MAESMFRDVDVYCLSVLACPHLALKSRTTVICEGFVWRERRVNEATDKGWEQHLIKFFCSFQTIILVWYSLERVLVFLLFLRWFHVQKLRDLSTKASNISSSTVNCSSGSRVTRNRSSILFWPTEPLMKSKWKKALKNPLVPVRH